MPAKRTETTTSKAPAARKRTVRRKPAVPTQEEIATRAYFLHLDGGHDAFENWLRAERELATA